MEVNSTRLQLTWLPFVSRLLLLLLLQLLLLLPSHPPPPSPLCCFLCFVFFTIGISFKPKFGYPRQRMNY